jgi:hypothetical protein
MIAIHIEAARRVRRQPGIVVGLLDQIFRAAALVVKPGLCTAPESALPV